MKDFKYVIQDPVGIHARPASQLIKACKALDSVVTIKANGKSAGGRQLMGILSLGVTQGTEVTVEIDGGDEEASLAALTAFFKENL